MYLKQSFKKHTAKTDQITSKNRQIHNNRDFKTTLSVIDRRNRNKISKVIISLNNIINQLNLTDIHRTLYPKTADYIFFSIVQGALTSKISHWALKQIS